MHLAAPQWLSERTQKKMHMEKERHMMQLQLQKDTMHLLYTYAAGVAAVSPQLEPACVSTAACACMLVQHSLCLHAFRRLPVWRPIVIVDGKPPGSGPCWSMLAQFKHIYFIEVHTLCCAVSSQCFTSFFDLRFMCIVMIHIFLSGLICVLGLSHVQCCTSLWVVPAWSQHATARDNLAWAQIPFWMLLCQLLVQAEHAAPALFGQQIQQHTEPSCVVTWYSFQQALIPLPVPGNLQQQGVGSTMLEACHNWRMQRTLGCGITTPVDSVTCREMRQHAQAKLKPGYRLQWDCYRSAQHWSCNKHAGAS